MQGQAIPSPFVKGLKKQQVTKYSMQISYLHKDLKDQREYK